MGEVYQKWPKAIIVQPGEDGKGMLAVEGKLPEGEFEPTVYVHQNEAGKLALSIITDGYTDHYPMGKTRFLRKTVLIQFAVVVVVGVSVFWPLPRPFWQTALGFTAFGFCLCSFVSTVLNMDLLRRYKRLRKDVAEVKEISDALTETGKEGVKLH